MKGGTTVTVIFSMLLYGEEMKMNKEQIKSEIQWLEFEIKKLEEELPYKPRKIKQISEYRRQIEQKKLNLALAL